jgi:4-hydroxy-3-methylbut-2-enyl diphosphate reductase
VEEVRVTDEDEYFPPPRNLRELLGAVDAVAAVTMPTTAPGLALDDRNIDASDVLESLQIRG